MALVLQVKRRPAVYSDLENIYFNETLTGFPGSRPLVKVDQSSLKVQKKKTLP